MQPRHRAMLRLTDRLLRDPLHRYFDDPIIGLTTALRVGMEEWLDDNLIGPRQLPYALFRRTLGSLRVYITTSFDQYRTDWQELGHV